MHMCVAARARSIGFAVVCVRGAARVRAVIGVLRLGARAHCLGDHVRPLGNAGGRARPSISGRSP